ncbi:MAG: hypothetical protein WD941_07355 [Opitutus sp.]
MKIHVALVVAVLSAGTVAVQTAPAAAPAAAAAGKAAPGKKKEEPPPKMEGQEVSRGDRGFMGVEIKEGKFVIHFYDKEKKPMKPDVARIALRWDPRYKLGMERLVLNPGPENTMTSPRYIRPPYHFKLFVVLLQDAAEGEDAAGETHVIDLRQ